MTAAGTRRLLVRWGLGLLGTVASVAAVRATTYGGVSLFELFEHSRYQGLVADALGAAWREVTAPLQMDPLLGAVLVPGLIVALLMLGGVYLASRRAG
jgi:hypothetical protein